MVNRIQGPGRPTKAISFHDQESPMTLARRISRRLMLLTVPECLLCPLPRISFLLVPLVNSCSPLRGPAQTPLLLFQISTDYSLSQRHPDPHGPGQAAAPGAHSCYRTCTHHSSPITRGVPLERGLAQSWRTETRRPERNHIPRRGRV